MKIKLRSKPVKNKMLSLYLDIHHDGNRTKKYLEIYVHEKPKNEIEKQHNNERYDLVKKITANYELNSIYELNGIKKAIPKNFDFIDYFQNYIDHYTKKDKRNHQGALNNLIKFLQIKYGVKKLPSSKISKLLCEDYGEYLKDNFSGFGPVTYWKKFKKVLKRSYSENFIAFNPEAIEIKFGTSDDLKKEVLEIDELVLLMNTPCINDHVKRAFLYCCLCSGYGWGEVKQLTFADITKSGGRVKSERNKTDFVATTYMSDLANSLVTEIGKPDEAVFNLNMTANGANKTLKNWIKSAGINKHITWYCGRHTYATLLNDLNLDLRNLAAALGHSEKSGFKYVMRYTRVKNKKIEEKVNQISDLILKNST